jgi:hypothetical protein
VGGAGEVAAGCSVVVGVGVVLVLQPSGRRVRRMSAVFFIVFSRVDFRLFAEDRLVTTDAEDAEVAEKAWDVEAICGGLVGSLEWKVLLLRLEWSATGALVFD